MGDLGHIQYKHKVGSSTWQVTRVIAIKPSLDGVVRTITVGFRPRHMMDKAKKYCFKPQDTMEIGVQCFAVLLPIKEQGEDMEGAEDSPEASSPLPSSEMTLN